MENELQKRKKTLRRRIKTLKKALAVAEKRLIECEGWQTERHAAELIQANLYNLKKGDKKAIVEDWASAKLVEIPLDPKIKPHEEVAIRFKRSAKLKKGLIYALQGRDRIKIDLEYHLTLLDELEAVQDEESFQAIKEKLPEPQKKPEKRKKETSKPYIEYVSESGKVIWVGKTAVKNDELTFGYANGNDLWMHAAEWPGSHVVVRGNDIDEKTFQKALYLAIYHSKARVLKEGEVIVTKVKHVRRFGKIKGKVQVAGEKKYYVKF